MSLPLNLNHVRLVIILLVQLQMESCYSEGCVDTSLEGSGSFSSPNYPHRYPPNYNCTWTLQATGGSTVCLTFARDFSVEIDAIENRCNYDFILVTTSSGIQKCCGNTSPGTIQTGLSTVSVTFSSDSTIYRRGFSASFTSGKCVSAPNSPTEPTLPRGNWLSGEYPSTGTELLVSYLGNSFGGILHIQESSRRVTEVIIPKQIRPPAVCFGKQGTIYFSDVNKMQVILKAKYKSSSADLSLFQTKHKLEIVDGIDYDHSSGLIYYTEEARNCTGVVTADMETVLTLFCKENYQTLDKPRAIKVHPRKGMMFWSDWGKTPSIWSADMTGSNRLAIVQTGLQYPNGLDIDYDSDRLYWCDGGTDRIESARLDGTDRRVLHTGNPDDFYYGITVTEQYLYFTNKKVSEINRIRKDGSGREEVFVSFPEGTYPEITGIDAINRYQLTKETSGCYGCNGGCLEVCLAKPGNKVHCLCPSRGKLRCPDIPTISSVEMKTPSPREFVFSWTSTAGIAFALEIRHSGRDPIMVYVPGCRRRITHTYVSPKPVTGTIYVTVNSLASYHGQTELPASTYSFNTTSSTDAAPDDNHSESTTSTPAAACPEPKQSVTDRPPSESSTTGGPTADPMCAPAPAGVNAGVQTRGRGTNMEAIYSCNNGFIRVSGDERLTCTRGVYDTISPLRCDPVCAPAPAGVNARVQTRGRGINLEAYYSCNNGFVRVLGDETLTCTGGVYGSNTPLRCARKCASAPDGTDSIKTVTGEGPNLVATYTCRSGFMKAVGREKLTCTDGKYDSLDALNCSPACATAPAGINAGMQMHGGGAYLVATYSCSPGFVRVSGNAWLVCSKGVYNSNTPLRCERKCATAPCGTNADKTVRGGGANLVATYTCRNGYERASGRAQLTCTNGDYDYMDSLHCNPVCPPPPAGVNAVAQLRGHGTHLVATYYCDYGFVRVAGDETLACTGGSFDSNTPLRCGTACATAPAGTNAGVQIHGGGTDLVATYTCNHGFVRVSGNAWLVCSKGVYNSNSPLKCERRCAAAPCGTNADKTVTGEGANLVATYICRNGYKRAGGRAQLTCTNGDYDYMDSLHCIRSGQTATVRVHLDTTTGSPTQENREGTTPVVNGPDANVTGLEQSGTVGVIFVYILGGVCALQFIAMVVIILRTRRKRLPVLPRRLPSHHEMTTVTGDSGGTSGSASGRSPPALPPLPRGTSGSASGRSPPDPPPLPRTCHRPIEDQGYTTVDGPNYVKPYYVGVSKSSYSTSKHPDDVGYMRPSFPPAYSNVFVVDSPYRNVRESD